MTEVAVRAISFFVVFSVLLFLMEWKNLWGLGKEHENKKDVFKSIFPVSLLATIFFMIIRYYF